MGHYKESGLKWYGGTPVPGRHLMSLSFLDGLYVVDVFPGEIGSKGRLSSPRPSVRTCSV